MQPSSYPTRLEVGTSIAEGGGERLDQKWGEVKNQQILLEAEEVLQ